MFNLSGITDFVSDYITDSLKRVVQPAVLFSSAIFVLLNLVFIYPEFLKADIAAATYFRDAGTIWQVVFISIVVLILAYILSSLQSGIMKLFTGELWSDTPLIAEALRKYQKHLRDGGHDERAYQDWVLDNSEFKIDEQEPEKLLENMLQIRQKNWERSTKYPQERGYLAPTTLGNIVGATSSNIWQKYRIDMTLLWPYMEQVLEKDDQTLLKRVADEKTTLNFLLNTVFILLVFAAEYLLMRLFWPGSIAADAVLLIAIGIACLVFYKAAIGKARTWGQVVQMSFEYHRDGLRSKLGLRDIEHMADERDLFRGVSKWLRSGTQGADTVKSATEFPYSDLGGKKTWHEDAFFKNGVPKGGMTKATVTHQSDNAKIELISSQIEKSSSWLQYPDAGVKEQSITVYKNEFEYVVFLNNALSEEAKELQQAADGVYFIVADPRVPWIFRPINEFTWSGATLPEYKIQYTGKVKPGHQLLWSVDRLPSNGARLLTYQLPCLRFAAIANNQMLTVAHEGPLARRLDGSRTRYKFEINNPGYQAIRDATVDVYRFGSEGQAIPMKALNTILNGNALPDEKIDETKSPDGIRFQLGIIHAKSSSNLTFDGYVK